MGDCSYWYKLKEVFKQLVLQTQLTLDDTCLQKLLDGINTALIGVEESELQVFCDFLAAVSLDGEGDENVRSFSVHLLGVLCETEPVFKQLLVNGTVDSFFSKLSCNLLKQGLSVLSATFSTLGTVIRHTSGLSWLLQSHYDIISTCFEVLKSGTSVFVVSSSQKFLSDLCFALTCSQTHAKDGTSTREVCANAHKDILVRTWAMIEQYGEPKSPVARTPTLWSHTAGCLTGLQLIKSLVDKGHNCCPVADDKVDILLNCLFTNDHSVHSYALDILQTCAEMRLAGLQLSVHTATERLLRGGYEESALSLAQRMFHRFPVADRGQLQNIAMSPLDLVLGIFSEPSTAHPQLQAYVTASRSLISRTLAATINSVLHLPPEEKQNELLKVLKVLEVTMGRPMQNCAPSRVHLAGNSSIQRCCLDTVTKCLEIGLSDGLSQGVLTELYPVLISLTEDTLTPVQILMPLFKTWKSALVLHWRTDKLDRRPGGDNSDGSMAQILERLSLCVEKKLCDLQWEIRDTALDFLCDLLSQKDVPEAVVWVRSHGLDVSLWQCVRDRESYVRASALSAVTSLLQRESQCLQQHCSLEDMVEKVCNIVQTDSEAFPRRAAVNLLSAILDFSNFPSDQRTRILATLHHAAIKDFDWDVQVKALNFWENFLDVTLATSCSKENVPDYAATLMGTQINGFDKKRKVNNQCMFEELEKSGVFNVLLKCLEDCDKSVREQSCKILIKVKPKLAENWPNSSGEKKMKVDSSLSGSDSLCKNPQRSNSAIDVISTENFIDLLSGMDLEAKLAMMCKSSDEYIRNPESLLDDILNSFSTKDTDHVIDCY